MTNEISGIIGVLKPTKNGTGTMLGIRGVDGLFFDGKTALSKVDFKLGDSVKFTYTTNGQFKNFDVSSLTPISADDVPKRSPKAPKSKDEEKQEAIHSGQMFNLAVEIAIAAGNTSDEAITKEYNRLSILKKKLDSGESTVEQAVEGALGTDFDFGEDAA